MRLHDASPRSCVWAHTHAHIHPRAATHTSTRIHTCPPVCPRTPTHSQAYAHAHPRLPPRALTYAHTRSHIRWCAATQPLVRYAYARKRTGNHRASTFAHTSDLRPHYAPMSHAHTPMHAWGGGRQAHYAPSRNVVRGVTPMRRRGYALCVHGRNTMRDVTQLGVNGCKRVRLGTTWADASVCVWASGGVENPSWTCMGAFGHTWTHTWVHTWVHEGQKFHFWDK